MSEKEKNILNKLFKIANNQQKILKKLAQNAQPNEEVYLKNTWQTAALNSGVTSVGLPTVTYTPESKVDGLDIEGSYTVSGEIPANKRELMLKNFTNQISSQKPDLEGRVSTIFKDPSTHV